MPRQTERTGPLTQEEILQAAAMAGFMDDKRAAGFLWRLIGEVRRGNILTDAARDVLAERRRQIEAEGWHHEHDDAEHDNGSLARAAACYAIGQNITIKGSVARRIPDWSLWPWDMKWWKPKDRRRDLVRAGALILAEIERLDRAQP